MSSLAHFCNRIGIDSHLLRVIKKDNILYNKKTAEPLSDWVIFNAVNNPIQDSLIFHKFRDDENFYTEPYSFVANNLPIMPRNTIHQKATKESTFQRHNNQHSIIVDNQPYFTNLFNKACEGVSDYKMIYPFEDFGNFSFSIDFRSEVLTLKRISTSLVNRSNLDVLDADNYSYAARLNLYHGANQKMHFSPHYITDFSDDINRKLMVINHAVYDLWQDLSDVPGFLKSSIYSFPNATHKLKGHYFTITDTGSGLDMNLDSFFKFTINFEASIKLAKQFIKRYNNYNDPIALHVMKMLNIINPVSLDLMMAQDLYDFYNDIEAFENYIKVFEMTTI
jgi:uncharacterized protein YfkK (UPF0435 family)